MTSCGLASSSPWEAPKWTKPETVRPPKLKPPLGLVKLAKPKAVAKLTSVDGRRPPALMAVPRFGLATKSLFAEFAGERKGSGSARFAVQFQYGSAKFGSPDAARNTFSK